jgi:3-isopropylmalate/(R)-2-methylmalate dehydratase small subunit
MQALTQLTATALPLPVNDIDTDQIIPARFLKVTTREGLGQHLFEDLRRKGDGTPVPTFPLNSPIFKGAGILIGGDNFGCGSSREHAVWALTDYGFRAVVSSSFADIFRGNALKNGLLPIVVPPEVLHELQQLAVHSPATELTVDLAGQELRWANKVQKFTIDAFSRTCIMHGVDELGYILRLDGAISTHEAKLSAEVGA